MRLPSFMGPYIGRLLVRPAIVLTTVTGTGAADVVEYRDLGIITYTSTAKACPARENLPTGIVIHHDTYMKKPRNHREMVELVEKMGAQHEKRFGCGPSYHYIVWEDGEVWRMNDVMIKTNHTLNNNSRNVAICVNGNFEEEEFSWRQERATRKAIDRVMDMYPSIVRVLPHRSYKPTACPGRNVVEALSDVWTIG